MLAWSSDPGCVVALQIEIEIALRSWILTFSGFGFQSSDLASLIFKYLVSHLLNVIVIVKLTEVIATFIENKGAFHLMATDSLPAVKREYIQ